MTSIEQLYSIYLEHPVICTDTRKLSVGCLFFCLKGEHFDGNQFALFAIENGAAYAITDNPEIRHEKCLYVGNTLDALQQLANRHRRSFDIPIIAIGGSNGKTTTKELVSAVLSRHYPCHFTKGNFNNHIGVPLTLLSMPADTEVAVIEMGANKGGDIDELCRITAPTHGLLTNIGKEHLEGFGNLAGVKKAEGELYRYLARLNGFVFVNLSEKYLSSMSRRNQRKIFYKHSDALNPFDGTIDVLLLDESPFIEAAFLSDAGEFIQIKTKLVGRHNFNNIMTAIALGIYFKVPPLKIKAALEEYTPSNNRSQLIQRGNITILLDAYNANPSSMLPALDSLSRLKAPFKIAVLGDMLELGADSLKEHEAILKKAAKYSFDQLLIVGTEFGKVPWAKYGAVHFPDTASAKKWLDAQTLKETLILVKGSRGIGLEKLFDGL